MLQQIILEDHELELSDFLKNGTELEDQTDPNAEPPKDIEEAKEMLKSFFANGYQGEWITTDPSERGMIHSSFENYKGIAKVSR